MLQATVGFWFWKLQNKADRRWQKWILSVVWLVLGVVTAAFAGVFLPVWLWVFSSVAHLLLWLFSARVWVCLGQGDVPPADSAIAIVIQFMAISGSFTAGVHAFPVESFTVPSEEGRVTVTASVLRVDDLFVYLEDYKDADGVDRTRIRRLPIGDVEDRELCNDTDGAWLQEWSKPFLSSGRLPDCP